MAEKRRTNKGIRKICGCSRRSWSKCAHPWHFNFKPKGGPAYRFSLDAELNRPIKSKTEAETEAEKLRIAIRAGEFRRKPETLPEVPATTSDVVTLEKFSETYFERKGKPASGNDKGCLARLLAFGDLKTKAIGAITEDDLEAFFADLTSRKVAASTRNKYVQLVKGLFRWAMKKKYIARDPAADSDHLKRERHAQRHRRLEPTEEAALMQHAGPHLQRLILAALETGCRRGESLGLTWKDVNLKRREITLRAEATKTKTERVLPISARLLAVLEMAKTDPKGEEFGPEAFVFGDVTGGRVANIKRAWETAVLKAHGHTPSWTAQKGLSEASRAALRVADLHFHDLRHEAGSRLLEAGWPLHHVQHMLGHANLSQTSTYLNATRIGLQESMRRFDEAAGCNPVASEADTDHPPVRNDEPADDRKPLVN